MDLNYLYSQQQISLIRASDTGCADNRAHHHATADGFARRIASFRREFQLRDGLARYADAVS